MRRVNLTVAILAAVSLCDCVTPIKPPSLEQQNVADYGAPPSNFSQAIAEYFNGTLKDPESIQYREITDPVKGFFQDRAPVISGGKITTTYGWMVKATINAKNSYGGYVGFKTFSFFFRGEQIINVDTPDAD